MDQSSEDRVPQMCRGKVANLEPFRSAIQSGFVQEVLNEQLAARDEFVLSSTEGVTVKATWKEEEETSCSEGRFLVTTERILYVSVDEKSDLAVDAECIQLHAVSDDSIYIQIQDPLSDESATIEFTVTPTQDSSSCPELFDALSRLASMHPIPLEDDDDDEGFDEAIFAPPVDVGASEEEREAMLERLDAMLVVPPEYEREGDERVEVGQFDDADEDEDDDML